MRLPASVLAPAALVDQDSGVIQSHSWGSKWDQFEGEHKEKNWREKVGGGWKFPCKQKRRSVSVSTNYDFIGWHSTEVSITCSGVNSSYRLSSVFFALQGIVNLLPFNRELIWAIIGWSRSRSNSMLSGWCKEKLQFPRLVVTGDSVIGSVERFQLGFDRRNEGIAAVRTSAGERGKGWMDRWLQSFVITSSCSTGHYNKLFVLKWWRWGRCGES